MSRHDALSNLRTAIDKKQRVHDMHDMKDYYPDTYATLKKQCIPKQVTHALGCINYQKNQRISPIGRTSHILSTLFPNDITRALFDFRINLADINAYHAKRSEHSAADKPNGDE